MKGVDAQVTPHSAITYKQLNEKFNGELERSSLVEQIFNPLGKPMPFFVPHQMILGRKDLAFGKQHLKVK